MITFHKPGGFPIDVIPSKSNILSGWYVVSFTSDEPFEVRYTYINQDGESERMRLYADHSLVQDFALYSVGEIIPDLTQVEIVPCEDAVKRSEKSVLEYALSVVSQVLSKPSDKAKSEVHL